MALEAMPGDGFVQSLARGLAVVRAFDAEHTRMTLSEVASRTGLTRATARRFLLTLATLGYVRAEDGRFELTPRVLELGYAYLSALRLPEIIQPHLADLSRRIGESSSASVLDGDDIVYIARASTRRIMRVDIMIGTRMPAATTAMGRVLLAGRAADAGVDAVGAAGPAGAVDAGAAAVDAAGSAPGTLDVAAAVARAAADGFALVDGELEPGLRSVAVPVHARGGEVVAAVNVAVSTRTPLDELAGPLLDALRDTAARIESDLALQ
ncbi:IclR family transcriptional regulator domain-containing protein [Agromyces archimandritae]|uniref:Glycerol operon regulatory protein n=1 Tax=Agromyces archimandritae TaxID=2781962 RepID=A0A975FQQ7_9MICO|nr:IclR family transcriptional regulator C-terminal domain-containing protein [Agromyces archimandritae]QTX06267.1 helix-turn-helix domain-containing protein [Agromyces archimandritae]